MRPLPACTYEDQVPHVVRSLPADYYFDLQRFELEKRSIFYKEWQCIGHVGMAAKPGDYFTGKIVDQEVLVVRGQDNELRAFFNVCQHRGHQLKTDKVGSCRTIVCPYHAWAYALDGSLRGLPTHGSLPGFDKEAIRLKTVRLEIFCGLVFVSLDPAAKLFKEEFGWLESEIRSHIANPEDQRLVCDYPIVHNCNWKASVEGFSECYHCTPVHHYLVSNVVDPTTYVLTVRGRTQFHSIMTRSGEMNQLIWFFWPNTAAGVYPIPGVGTVFCLRHMYPIDVNTTHYHYRWFATGDQDEQKIREYAAHHETTTGAEDAAVATGVQNGAKSLGFDQGYLMADPTDGSTSEHAIARFHAWYRDALPKES